MKRTFVIILFIAVISVFASCSKFQGSEKEESINTSAFRSVPSEPSVSADIESPVYENTTPEPAAERKRIVNAYLSIISEDIKSAEIYIKNRAVKSGGWVVSSNLHNTSISITVKIPADSLDTFLSDSENIGKIKSRSITAEDITESYYDLDNRIKNKKLLQNKYREYLNQTRNMEEILSVERQLNNITVEIEQLEGRFRRMKRDTAYSTVNFDISPPVSESISERLPSFKEAFSVLKYKVITFLYYFFFTILYIIIFGIPIIAAAGLIYFAGWGKLGIVRRFFKKLR